jgi:DNA repair protein RecO (recombination protein O)
MSRTYKATGINLKSIPLGEADRLLTILTREFGLIQAVAMGSRKTNSKLSGRSSLFVVNELLIAKGKALDKITQAETLESYPGLAKELQKLTAGQYLAELCLCQALSEQPQDHLFVVLNQHLKQIEQAPLPQVLPHLIQAIYHLFALAGVAPQVHRCCLTQQAIRPPLENPQWRVGFSPTAGGLVTLEAIAQRKPSSQPSASSVPPTLPSYRLITASETTLLQVIAQATINQEDSSVLELPDFRPFMPPIEVWLSIERIFRQYAQYHFDRPIRSAALIDACFAPSSL